MNKLQKEIEECIQICEADKEEFEKNGEIIIDYSDNVEYVPLNIFPLKKG